MKMFDRDSYAMRLRHVSKCLKSLMAHELFDIVCDFILMLAAPCWRAATRSFTTF